MLSECTASFDQRAHDIMSTIGAPARSAFDAAAPLTVCALKIEVSMPANSKNQILSLAIVSDANPSQNLPNLLLPCLFLIEETAEPICDAFGDIPSLRVSCVSYNP